MNKNYTTSPSHTHGSDQDQDQNTELPQSRDHHDRTTMTVTTMTVTTHRSVTATTHRSPRLHTVRTTHRSPRPPTTATTPVRDHHLEHHDCELGPSSDLPLGPFSFARSDQPITYNKRTRILQDTKHAQSQPDQRAQMLHLGLRTQPLSGETTTLSEQILLVLSIYGRLESVDTGPLQLHDGMASPCTGARGGHYPLLYAAR